MDAVLDRRIWRVVVKSSAQVGKSEIILNIIGYFAHQDPSPIIQLQPTIQMAEAFSRDRVATMIRDTKALSALFADPKSRDSGNTLLYKKFPGGYLTLIGGNSPSSLASRPARIVLADEIDRLPPSAGNEGDPLALLVKRTNNYHNRIVVEVSTPTIDGASRIQFSFSQSDQRFFNVPCPACGQLQSLKWANFHWSRDLATSPDDIWIECEGCASQIREAQKPLMMRHGKWIATAESNGVAGFHLNELLSPWSPWRKIRDEFLAAKGDPELLRVFINTSLGEVWQEQGEGVEADRVQARTETYPAPVPGRVLFLTAGIDTQPDRLEMTVDGWAYGEENYKIAHIIVWGDTTKPEVWNDLDSHLLLGRWRREDGVELKIKAACVDTAGHSTQRAYAFCKGKRSRRVFAIVGRGGEGRPYVSSPARKRYGRSKLPVELFTVGVDEIKRVIYRRLSAAEPGPGYIHFPDSDDFGPEYFAQLAAEKMVTEYRHGVPKRRFKQVRDRNEALDCSVYSYAAMQLMAPNWRALERKRASHTTETGDFEPQEVLTPQAEVKRPVRRPGRRGWMSGL
jgi:phage terminase large subunit GpA-like protein